MHSHKILTCVGSPTQIPESALMRCQRGNHILAVDGQVLVVVGKDRRVQKKSEGKRRQHICQHGEIATNVLADRLKMLQEQGIIVGERSASDARMICYRPTTKGLDLLPVMVEMIIWADQYEDTAAPAKIIRRLKEDRTAFIAEVRKNFPESK